ncbi:4Fe-4S binding protein [Aminipila terrae]|uniref:4Fe-4S binding protein n=1 Tax=Aminipila terrae TaxID=2697030 RepID=A0A6P1MC39_9FIRM|nr:4Fe-4S binding protein [Aminipila terrae]QHI71421.1 4Fe-4S binding protein [Aminipila terrae]
MLKNFQKLWKKYSFILLLIFIFLSLFDFRFAVAAGVCMAAPVILAIFKGRYWCGNICPRGSFYDHVVSRFSNKRKVPEFFKSYIFRAFILTAMMTMFTLGVRDNWGDLYGIGFVFYRMIVITTVIGITFSLFYNHRTWCHFCPMGTLASLISVLRKNKKVLHVSDDCVSCKICEKQCSLGIIPYKYKGSAINHADCIQCGKCVISCPKKSISY